MSKGFDTDVSLTRFATALAQDYDFVGRYYNINNPAKNLTMAEAQALSNAGLRIVAIWENGYPTNATYFSYVSGLTDGANAYNYARQQIQQPGSTPIYFIVDYDATTGDIDEYILKYFQGIEDVFNAISSYNPLYKIGVYGSGTVCSKIKQANPATYTWLAQSTGWLGSNTFNTFNIQQQLTITACPELGGVKGDPNHSPLDNEGSFTISGASL